MLLNRTSSNVFELKLRTQTLANIHEIFQNIHRIDLLYILLSEIGSSFCKPYTRLDFQMAPGNGLCHHNTHLMEHFKFFHGSRMTYLPLNISEKFH